jgi:hypothetical protein
MKLRALNSCLEFRLKKMLLMRNCIYGLKGILTSEKSHKNNTLDFLVTIIF